MSKNNENADKKISKTRMNNNFDKLASALKKNLNRRKISQTNERDD